MRFGLLFLAILLVSCGSDNPVGGSNQPTDGEKQTVTLKSLVFQGPMIGNLETRIRPGGGLIVAGKMEVRDPNPVDIPFSYPVEFHSASGLKIAKPLRNSCNVGLFVKLVSSEEKKVEVDFEVHTQWADDAQRMDCWVFEAEMRQVGLLAGLENAKVGERDTVEWLGLVMTVPASE